MPFLDHANEILDFFAKRRDANGRIAPISSVDLLVATGRNPQNYAIVYGQVSSLLDIACLEAEQPLIGRLVLFDHRDPGAGPWANWVPFESLLYFSAPQLKRWSDTDLEEIRNRLKPGRPSDVWRDMESRSEELLMSAIRVGQGVIEQHVRDLLHEAGEAPNN